MLSWWMLCERIWPWHSKLFFNMALLELVTSENVHLRLSDWNMCTRSSGTIFCFFIFRWVLQIVTSQIHILWGKEKEIWNTSEQDDFGQHLLNLIAFLPPFFYTLVDHQFWLRQRRKMSDQGPVSRKTRNFSGDIILFVSSKRRCSVSRNFAVILILFPFNIKKTSFIE